MNLFVSILFFVAPLVSLTTRNVVDAFQPVQTIHPLSKHGTALGANPTSDLFENKSSDNLDHHRNSAFSLTVMASTLLLSTAVVLSPSPAWSEQSFDITKGEVLFQANCAGCHAGGNNYVSEKRTLRKNDIQQYRGSTDQATITNFVQNGMPHKLLPMKAPMEDKDYNDVVAYVLEQALGEKW